MTQARDWHSHLDPLERAAVRSWDAEITGLDATIKRLREERRRLAKQRELYVNRGSARAKLYAQNRRKRGPYHVSMGDHK